MASATTTTSSDEPVAFLDGVVVPLAEARVPVTDRGFLYGDGVFTSARVEGGRVRLWAHHAARLQRDTAAIGLAMPTEAELQAAIGAVMARLPPKAQLRVSLTRLAGGGWPTSRGGEPARIVVIGRPLGNAPPMLTAITHDVSPHPKRAAHKLVNYLDQVLALQHAAQSTADEALGCDASHGALEFATGCLFVRTAAGESLMPAHDAPILDSVARRAICEALGAAGEPLPTERVITRADLAAASEIVHANAVRGPRTVIMLDGRPLPPGPLVAQLSAAFTRAVDQTCEA